MAATPGRIRTAIERMDDEYLRSAVDYISRKMVVLKA
ncbi:unnamed protein product [Linum tenue]|uniref:Uncharacterized protein n=1 Tax=Linum tenue TaxID=586396 RepID=A0AAV0L8J8_9ROSI|nr:unnamed protein product [Linum tenue]